MTDARFSLFPEPHGPEIDPEVTAALDRGLGDADGLLGVDSFERRLRADFGELDDVFARLSGRLSRAALGPPPDVFRWTGGRWARPSAGEDPTESLDSRPSACVRGLVEGLVEEERIGAWVCSRPGKRATTLRLRQRLEGGAGDVEVQVEARGDVARVRVKALDGPVTTLGLRRGAEQLERSAAPELSCELPLEELDGLDLLVGLTDAEVRHTRLPLSSSP